MHESELARILEPALQAQIATRCHRAYRHELKNGLQGIYGGFDALSRLSQLPVKDNAKFERISELVRQALSGHEKSMERVLHGLAPLEQASDTVSLTALLQELVKFLLNDAAAQQVTVRGPGTTAVAVQARHPKLRLALLSLMVDALDAMPRGGMLQVSATSGSPCALVEITDTRLAMITNDPWAIDLSTAPAYRGWLLFVVRQLIHAEGGSITCESVPEGGRKVRILLPSAQ